MAVAATVDLWFGFVRQRRTIIAGLALGMASGWTVSVS